MLDLSNELEDKPEDEDEDDEVEDEDEEVHSSLCFFFFVGGGVIFAACFARDDSRFLVALMLALLLPTLSLFVCGWRWMVPR